MKLSVSLMYAFFLYVSLTACGVSFHTNFWYAVVCFLSWFYFVHTHNKQSFWHFFFLFFFNFFSLFFSWFFFLLFFIYIYIFLQTFTGPALSFLFVFILVLFLLASFLRWLSSSLFFFSLLPICFLRQNCFRMNQWTRELISTLKMSHEHSNEDLSESLTVTLTWHASTYKVHELHWRYTCKVHKLFQRYKYFEDVPWVKF